LEVRVKHLENQEKIRYNIVRGVIRLKNHGNSFNLTVVIENYQEFFRICKCLLCKIIVNKVKYFLQEVNKRLTFAKFLKKC
jgi:hypothetical protein